MNWEAECIPIGHAVFKMQLYNSSPEVVSHCFLICCLFVCLFELNEVLFM